MRRSVLGFLSLLMLFPFCKSGGSGSDPESDSIIPPPGFDLVWHDEFEGSALPDPENWVHEVNGHGGGNNELQYYTDRIHNAFIENGTLIIRAFKETYTGTDGTRGYTSARLVTRGRHDWKYGRFEIRARLPEGQGLWPAIWMMPSESVYGGWAASGEIDIMEYLGHDPGRVYGTLHYGGSSPRNVHTGSDFVLKGGASFHSGFHVFAVEWDSASISWFVDDSLYQTQSSWYSTGGGFPAPFDQKFYLILNVAVGGSWPGSPDESTIFPQEMAVDYVRVFQKR
jgi:beta-glucanase (GH16 family)